MPNNIREQNMEFIQNTLEFIKKIDARDFTSIEQNQANTVIESFQGIEPTAPRIHLYKHFTSEDITNMVGTSLNTFTFFDNDLLMAIINDYLENTPIIDGGYTDESLFQTIYETITENNTPFKIPRAIIIPSMLNNTSGHHFVHEIAHILKNNNFQEQKLYITYYDVVPTLLELISAYESSPIQASEVFRKKRDTLIKTISIYNIYLRLYEIAKDDEKEQYKILLSTTGEHLSSFYYAMILFYIYLEKPFSILEDVHEVIDCQESTLDLIDEYTSKDENNNENYHKGFTQFNKIIS